LNSFKVLILFVVLFFSCSQERFSVQVGPAQLEIEVVMDVPSRSQGLMFRESLEENHGMLFIFPDSKIRAFWMKNTSIPLSIAYIDSRGRIQEIHDMEPFDLGTTESQYPAQYALELNQGAFQDLGIQVGDYIDLRSILPRLPNQGKAQN